jgi:hypothetical protein
MLGAVDQTDNNSRKNDEVTLTGPKQAGAMWIVPGVLTLTIASVIPGLRSRNPESRITSGFPDVQLHI